jgi:Spy/CpxP family protein refolding chaperone
MKKLMMGVLLGFLFLAVASHESYAESCGCGGEMGMHRGSTMMHQGPGFREGFHDFLWKKFTGLGLSDKQKDAFKTIQSRATKDTIKKRADLELARVELRELLDKDSVDMSAVEASLKKGEAIRTDLHLSHIKAMEEIKALLTPEQRKKFKEDFRSSFMRHEGRCGGPAAAPTGRKDEAPHGSDAK